MNHVIEQPYYGNYRFYHATGPLMFITSEKRAQFYIDRGLVTSTPENPTHFTFRDRDGPPGGYGFHHETLHEYHLQPKENQCVVCASLQNLTKHHVLPITFQRHYPNERGDAGVRSHDLLLPKKVSLVSTYNRLIRSPRDPPWSDR